MQTRSDQHTKACTHKHTQAVCEGSIVKGKNVFTKAPKAASESDSDCNGYSFSAQPRCCSRSCRIRSELNPRRCSSSQSQPTVHGPAALHLNNPWLQAQDADAFCRSLRRFLRTRGGKTSVGICFVWTVNSQLTGQRIIWCCQTELL